MDIDDKKQKYDGATFNFHLYPEDETVMKEIAEKVNNVRNEVIKQLKEQGAFVDREKFNKSYIDNNIYISAEINAKNKVVSNRGCGSRVI